MKLGDTTGRRYPTAEEVERVYGALTPTPQTAHQIYRETDIRGDRVGFALRILAKKGVAVMRNPESPRTWSLRRGA